MLVLVEMKIKRESENHQLTGLDRKCHMVTFDVVLWFYGLCDFEHIISVEKSLETRKYITRSLGGVSNVEFYGDEFPCNHATTIAPNLCCS